jgi:hypothetical protein
MNWLNIGFGAAIGGSLLVSLGGGIVNELSTTQNLTRSSIFWEATSEIAQKRYQKGCLLLAGGAYPNLVFPSVVEGGVIRNRETGQPLPRGTVVCDSQGATGVLTGGGVVSSVAVTPNREVVAKVMKRFRGGSYSQPLGGI